ncbi:hypothetical protein HQN86_01475 [Pedobacter panaciterrae]|uniref:BfmA/BtgA family mobilization protein n=1 Tax=Pedobacter panaciterrae TaxID=363849 RepID=UPI00155D9762|nr:BfmA/BtgA family mobilization protein [Pedobacter panaciterrae]NQX52274.1 hypothetical protein [Pedobacter panaciterrae]
MEQETLRTVKFPESVADKFDKIALKLGRSKRQVFTQMVDYFFRSKKDPADINDEFLKNTLLKSHKDYIGFIRTQEAELLIPIKTDVSRMLDALGRVIQSFNGQVLKQNDQIFNHQKLLLGNQEAQVKKFTQTDELMRRVFASLHTREQLKEKFLDIFEDYVKVRNSFNITTSAKEKETVIQKVRQKISHL